MIGKTNALAVSGGGGGGGDIIEDGVFGVSWVNDASTTMTRTDDATNMRYSITNGRVTSDFDNVFPYDQMKRTTIDGNVFVYVPEMYFRITTDENNRLTGVAVSKYLGEGNNWYKSKAFYYGAYGTSITEDSLIAQSVSGESRHYGFSRRSNRSQHTDVGEGYHQRDLYTSTILLFLWWIEFANKNSLLIMTGSYYGENTGGTDSFYNETKGANFCVSGFNVSNKQMVWHGIEDFVGNGSEYVDGITANRNALYISDDYTLYDDYNNRSFMDLSQYSLPNAGNIISFVWDESHPFLVTPYEVNNDSTFTEGFCARMASKSAAVAIGYSNDAEIGSNICTYLFVSRNGQLASAGARLIKEVEITSEE